MKSAINKIILLGILAVACLLIAGCGNKATGNAAADIYGSESGYTKIPLSDLSNELKFYEYEDDGVVIRYFAVLGSDGQPRTAFDACDICGGYKGYQQKGSDIECRNCGRVFSIDGLGTKNKGYGCWPGYLPHSIKGSDMIISIDNIKSGREKFA